MTFAGWLYHRRRVADLKNEIAQVQYIAEPASPPEQTQFDNPVYAYQGSSKFDDGTATLLNNFQFRNNLGTSKKINNVSPILIKKRFNIEFRLHLQHLSYMDTNIDFGETFRFGES